MAIVIAILAVALTGFFLGGVLSNLHSKPVAGRVLFLYFLVPSVQIYYASSLDALIAPLVVGACLVLVSKDPWLWIASALALILASFLSFGALFVLPVLFGFELWRRRRPYGPILLTAALALFYVGLELLSGFSYLRAFAVASSLENPEGFRLLAEPMDYLMTRAEDVAEIFLFFGPFLSIVFISGLSRRRASTPSGRLSIMALASFTLLLLTGAYRTGETARAALFMVPFLMLPAAEWIAATNRQETQFRTLASLVSLQTLIMQLLGDDWW
jgi:hypothetical protein